MIPFTSFKFFIFSFLVVTILVIFKKIISRHIKYNVLLSLLTWLFLLSLGFQGFLLCLFIVYCYVVYYLCCYKNFIKSVLLVSITIALPMIIYKTGLVSSKFAFVGLSYITFRTVQMVVDSKNNPPLRILSFVCFTLFPPTLLAGPIDRSYRFVEDLEKGYDEINIENLLSGWRLVLVGLLMKYVFANLISYYWMDNIILGSKDFLMMAWSAYSYYFFLYFDFAGYSLMAIGLAKMIGINVPINFNRPYLSKNPQDFWRRFHITLGSWLNDYLFKPTYKYLNGYSRLREHKLLIQNASLMLTFIVMGCWNGFKLHYFLSGFLFGLYSVSHNTYVFYCKKNKTDMFSAVPVYLGNFIKIFLMFNASVLALYFFSGRAPL